MKFSILSTLFLSLAAAAPTGERQESVALEKRIDPISTAILTAAGSAAVTAAVNEAFKHISNIINQIANWDDAREEFTKKTVEGMIGYANNEAAVCVNVGYSVDDTSKIRDLTSVEFKSGPLHTDYDCFFLSGPSTFNLQGDGGFVNIAVQEGPCDYNGGVMTCP